MTSVPSSRGFTYSHKYLQWDKAIPYVQLSMCVLLQQLQKFKNFFVMVDLITYINVFKIHIYLVFLFTVHDSNIISEQNVRTFLLK